MRRILVFVLAMSALVLSRETEGRAQVSTDSLEAVLKLAEASGNQKTMLSTTRSLADAYWKKGDMKRAVTNGQRAMELAGSAKLDADYIGAAMQLGYIFDALGDYDRSTELFFTALKKSEQLGDKKMVSRSLYGIGYTCFSQNNFPKSLEYYLKSLVISRELGDTTGIAGCLNNISAVYGSQNDTQYIERYVREAIAINLKMNNLHWVTINYGNLGSYFMERNQYDSAYRYFQKSWELALAIRNASQMAASAYRLASFYVRTGDPDQGLPWALKALDICERSGLKKQMYETAILLRDIFLAKQDILQAYHYDTLRYVIKDSLDLESNNTLLSKLELQYQLDKITQVKRLEEQQRLAVTLIVLVILLSVLAIMILLFLRHRLRAKNAVLEKEKLETELEFRNKELASNVMSLMKKNEILQEITQRLIEVQEKAAREETREAIQCIATDLQKSMDVHIWDEFELRFRQVHKDFYEKLLQKYPDLSPNEQKLCAFLRLNMTNKEISELTGQSIKALETARYRLRIKFGLSNSQVNLITFLSSI